MIGSNVRFAKTLGAEFDFANQELNQDADFGTLSFSIGYAHEYLPNNMTTDIVVKKGNNIDILSGNAQILEYNVDKNTMKLKVKNNEKNTRSPILYRSL